MSGNKNDNLILQEATRQVRLIDDEMRRSALQNQIGLVRYRRKR